MRTVFSRWAFRSLPIVVFVNVAGGQKPAASSSERSFSQSVSALVAGAREIVSPSPLPVVTLEFVLDASAGSPGGDKRLIRPSVGAVASVLAGLPGSVVRFWSIGDEASTTRAIGSWIVAPSPNQARQAVLANQSRQATGILGLFDNLVVPMPKRSPLLSSIVRVSQESIVVGSRHVVIFASDLLHSDDLGDLECHDPVIARWRAVLQSQHLFLSHAMDGLFLIAIHTDLRPVAGNRCMATIAHHDLVLNLWGTVSSAAGATFLPFTGDIAAQDFAKLTGGKL